jgi:hypothetical protein
MNRLDFIRLFVLNETADDYENFQKIAKEVTTLGNKCGVSIALHEIAQQLIVLIEAGHVKPYRLSTTEPAIELELWSAEQMGDESVFFGITPSGKRELSDIAAKRWPFNDEGVLRPGWIAPIST